MTGFVDHAMVRLFCFESDLVSLTKTRLAGRRQAHGVSTWYSEESPDAMPAYDVIGHLQPNIWNTGPLTSVTLCALTEKIVS